MSAPTVTGTAVRRTYLDTEWGQVHAITAGDGGPRIALFHESPLSGEIWLDVVELLAADARPVATDTPGYGASTPPDGPGHEIPEYAARLAEALAQLGGPDDGPWVLVGVHTGASLAIEAALRPEIEVAGVVLSGVALYTDEERQAHVDGWTPAVPSDAQGAAFDWAVERYTRIWPDLTADLLHHAAVQLLRVKDRYDWGYQAAFRHDPAESLAALDVPVLLLDAEHDLLADKDERALELAKDARLEILPGLPGQPHLRRPEEYARHVLAFARESTGGTA